MQRIGDYSVVEKIGAGGMGEVWLAENVHTRMRYAIKLLPQEATSDKSFVLRFFDEGRVMAELEHPRIVRVHHVGHDEDSGRYYLVMDYVVGPQGKPQSLHNALEQSPEKRLPEPQVRKWALQIAEGLAYTHGRGVVHRDIKPANVLIDKECNARITDFGLVKAVGQEFVMSQIHQTIRYTMRGTISDMPTVQMSPRAAGSGSSGGIEATIDNEKTISKQDSGLSRHGTAESLLGTYDYMSPEQRGGELPGVEVSPASDVYSFGVMLYRILTGRLPTGLAKPPSHLIPGLAAGWDHVIERCLEHDPSGRYPHAQAMLAELCNVGTRRAPASPARKVEAKTPAGVPALSEREVDTNRELVRQKIARWLEKNHCDWTKRDWKYFVSGLQQNGFTEGMSDRELAATRDEETRAWMKREETRKAQEAAVAEERRQALEEIRRTERTRVADEYRRAAEEARKAEETKVARERRHRAEMEGQDPDDVVNDSLLGRRPMLRADALVVLLTVAHAAGYLLSRYINSGFGSNAPLVRAVIAPSYHVMIAWAFWLAIERFRRFGVWFLWTLLAGGGWVAFVFYAEQQSLKLTPLQEQIAYNTLAAFILAILFRIIDQKFSFISSVMLIVAYVGSVVVASLLAETAIQSKLPIILRLLEQPWLLTMCVNGFAGFCQGISVGAVLVWASRTAKSR